MRAMKKKVIVVTGIIAAIGTIGAIIAGIVRSRTF